MKKLIMTIAITLMAAVLHAAKCQKCNDIGFHFEYVTCDVCDGRGTVRSVVCHRRGGSSFITSRCKECGKLGNKLGKVKVKVYCDCKTGQAKKERDEKPRKMMLR